MTVATYVELSRAEDAATMCKVSFQGARVVSWTVGGLPQVWTENGDGGIPLVFPRYPRSAVGATPAPLAFAADSVWTYMGEVSGADPAVRFELTEAAVGSEALAAWASSACFRAVLTITLYATLLKSSILVENRGKMPFSFHWLFQNHLYVPDLTDVVVNNLPGQHTHDLVLDARYEEQAPMIGFTEEAHRVYERVHTLIPVQVIEFGRPLVEVQRDNLPEVVLWTPWASRPGWQTLLGVQAGHLHDSIELKPHQRWQASQTLARVEEIRMVAL